MRIVSGIYGGRQIVAPKTRDTRPMTDKVRAALFDTLDDINGIVVLDAYAGSGAVGLEALSRGASQIVLVESARPALQSIKANISDLELTWGVTVIESTVEAWLARDLPHSPRTFDIIVADPPYARLKPDVIEKLSKLLGPGGVLILSLSSRKNQELTVAGMSAAGTKLYGDTALAFYRAAK